VFVVGLLFAALAISPVLTLAMASLGTLVWLVARVIHRDARLVSDAVIRDSAVQLSLLHEDLGMLAPSASSAWRTSRRSGSRSTSNGSAMPTPGGSRTREHDPTLWLLYGAAAALALGLVGYGVLTRQITPAHSLS